MSISISIWSSGLTVWDWLHGTLRGRIPQAAVQIGVPAYAEPDDVVLPKLVQMPFVEQRESWEVHSKGWQDRQ